MGCQITNRSNKLQKGSVLNSKLGMSLIEVLIALGMVGILSSVIATVMQQMQKAQNQVNVVNTIENMRINIQKLIADGNAWRQTVEAGPNASLVCVRTNSACNNTVGSGAIDSRDGTLNTTLDAAPFFDLPLLEQAQSAGGGPSQAYLNTTNPNSGFSSKGVPCTTWSPDGNDDCPIRWKLKSAFECQGNAPTCLNPTIRVIAILYYRNSGASDQRLIINENKFRVDIRRGAKGDTRAERFSADYSRSGPGANGGPCASSGTTIPIGTSAAPTNPTLNENGNVALAGGGVMNFNPGTYSCSANSTCFGCGSFRLELLVNNTSIFRSNSMLAKDQQLGTVSINQVTFTINAVTPVRLVQTCTPDPITPVTGVDDFGLGMALPDYVAPSKFAEIQCTRIF